MAKNFEMNWSTVGNDWTINLVNNITDRSNPSILRFDELPISQIYSLHIHYRLKGAKPHEADKLNYESLRREIAGNLAIPSNSLMEIFVAQRQGGRN